jgi:hypothetical protein
MIPLFSAAILVLYVFACIGVVTVIDLVFYAIEEEYQDNKTKK